MIPRQYRIHAMLVVVAVVIVVYPLLKQRPSKDKAEAAAVAAQAFLQQVDSDRFAESWEMTAAVTQEKSPQKQWSAQLATLRQITGPLVERSEDSVSTSQPVGDSPQGEYIVITYDSVYQRKPHATEIVTVLLGKDGVWRVAGYYIK